MTLECYDLSYVCSEYGLFAKCYFINGLVAHLLELVGVHGNQEIEGMLLP